MYTTSDSGSPLHQGFGLGFRALGLGFRGLGSKSPWVHGAFGEPKGTMAPCMKGHDVTGTDGISEPGLLRG